MTAGPRNSRSLVKITPPSLDGVLQRPRLYEKLDRYLERPAIYLTGPSGSGKTLLAASFLNTRKIPCFWYRIDRKDDDIDYFCHYLDLALKEILPGRKNIPLRQKHPPDSSISVLPHFESLFSHLQPPFAIVFDGVEKMSRPDFLYDAINNATRLIPNGAKVFITSRARPPSVFAPLFADKMMSVLGWEEIRFTLAESRELLLQKRQTAIGEEEILRIHEIAGGWAAGLALIGDEWESSCGGAVKEKVMPLRRTFAYMESELFDKVEPRTRRFLLKTAILPRMTATVVARFTGIRQPARVLRELIEKNYVIESQAAVDQCYEYPSLFRRFLVDRAKAVFTKKRITELRHRAARSFAQSGFTEEALDLYLENNECDAMRNLITDQAPVLTKEKKFPLLQSWLMRLPAELRENDAHFLFWLGVSHPPGDPATRESFLRRAFNGFQNDREPKCKLLSWACLVRTLGDESTGLSRLDSCLSEMENLEAVYDVVGNTEIKARVAASMLMALAYRQPACHLQVARWRDELLVNLAARVGPDTKIRAMASVAHYQVTSGRFQELAKSISLLRGLMQQPDASPSTVLIGYRTLAMHYQQVGQHEECLRAVERGLALAKTTKIHSIGPSLLGLAAMSSLDRGDLAGTRHLIKHADANPDSMSARDIAYFSLIRSREAMIEGRTAEALRHIRDALSHNEVVQSPFHRGLFQAFWAQLLEGTGNRSEAVGHLEEALGVAEEIESSLLKFFVHYAQAHLALARKDMAACLSALQQALGLGKQEGYLITSFDNPSVTAELAAVALERGIEVDYVREIIQKRQLRAVRKSIYVEYWPWPLKLFTLGVFAIEHEERKAEPLHKAQKKPLEIVKVLVSLKGRHIGAQQLADLLWPEADGIAAYSALTTNLSRLRHLLPHGNSIQLRDGTVFLDYRWCWVDAWAFEQRSAEAEKMWQTDEGAALREAQKALGLYQGHFLAHDGDYSWALPYREQLRDRHRRLVGRIVEYYRGIGEWDGALQFLQDGLRVDPFVERFYQQVMTCYDRLGEKARAVETYQRCRKMLVSTFGCDPSSATQNLYRSIVNK